MALRVVRVLAKLEPGGAQLSALRLSVALRAHGIETRLVVGDACRAGIRLAHEHGFEPECFRSRLSGLQWTPSRAFATWLAPRLGGADLVHAHMFGAWWAAARVVAPGVPLVASEHNALLWPGLSRDSALRAALPRVDHLFAHGPAVRAQLLAAGLPPQRLSPGRSPIAVTSARLAPSKGSRTCSLTVAASSSRPRTPKRWPPRSRTWSAGAGDRTRRARGRTPRSSRPRW